ncbi:MAG: hypothetical protein ACI8RD_013182 [Bacillariaceae sp.]|jgi:hypothetical protein
MGSKLGRQKKNRKEKKLNLSVLRHIHVAWPILILPQWQGTQRIPIYACV